MRNFITAHMELPKKFTGRNQAPQFRKTFFISDLGDAKLSICGLGIAYCYINGQAVSPDLFIAPASNYEKTLWYTDYDVSGLIKKGKNVIAVWCGNGWYNEDFRSSWDFDKAPWRDVPKLWLRLELDGAELLKTDSTWKARANSAIVFNGLRSGETFDDRAFEENWAMPDYDDTSWDDALPDEHPPKGVLRRCDCEPIRAVQEYKPISVKKTGAGKYLYDFGQNLSGFIKLRVTGTSGQQVLIRYAEQIKDDGSLELNDMQRHYPETAFQTDCFICSGRLQQWSPRFAYHGFRYAEISGLNNPKEAEVKAVFVHQDVAQRSKFACSDALLNQMFEAGIMSTWSNMFYMMTDCPTREKLGWTNDAQASADQILLDFHAERVLRKWLQDIWDAMKPSGELPGIIPTAGWGYHWGNGPVSDGVLFEIPYRIYLHTGNGQALIQSLPYFERYLHYLNTKRDKEGFLCFGLTDWAKPDFDQDGPNDHVPAAFINALLLSEFLRIASLAEKLCGRTGEYYQKAAKEEIRRVCKKYIAPDGTCLVPHMTAVSMLIYYGAYEQLEPLKQQLAEMLMCRQYRHDCGMVGMRRLLYALDRCGMQEEAYRVLTVDNPHGYRDWFEHGATTLWETWNCERHEESKNHHMYSSFMTWLITSVVGIKQEKDSVGFRCVYIDPYFLKNLSYAEASCDTVNGKISVCWKRTGAQYLLTVDVPEKMIVKYHTQKLASGKNEIRVRAEENAL